MKKITVFFLIIAAFILLFDFNTYEKQIKNISCDDEGIIFSITSFDGKSETKPFVKCLGHTWVSIENRKADSLYIKNYEIKSGDSLTFSVWELSSYAGVVFNLESEFIREYGRFNGRKTLSMNISESQIKIIEEYIENNGKWTLIKNCSYWSLNLWNMLANNENKLKTQTLLYSPKRLIKSFDEYDCVLSDKDFSSAGKAFIFIDGKRTEMNLCS